MEFVNYEATDTLYALKMELTQDNKEVTIGKLGTFVFQKGFYVYVGSAKRNIQSRINRHIKMDKKLHWHVDYLRPSVQILEVQTYSEDKGECQLFQKLLKKNNGSIPVQGFGSSDCRCAAHLFYMKNEE